MPLLFVVIDEFLYDTIDIKELCNLFSCFSFLLLVCFFFPNWQKVCLFSFSHAQRKKKNLKDFQDHTPLLDLDLSITKDTPLTDKSQSASKLLVM